MTLITKQDIRIDSIGRWWFRSEQITNPGILKYFKLNLRRDESRAYYIANRFGEKEEHGYLESVAGFPLFIDSIIPLGNGLFRVYLDSEEVITSEGPLFMFSEDNLGLIVSDRGIPARLTGPAMASLVNYLEESDGRFALRPADSDVLEFLEPGRLERLFV